MNNETQLTDAIEKLRSEIAALEHADVESRRKLESLVGDLERSLQNPQDTQLHEDLAGQLKDAMLQLEVSHPTLTAIMNDLMMKLSNIGI